MRERGLAKQSRPPVVNKIQATEFFEELLEIGNEENGLAMCGSGFLAFRKSPFDIPLVKKDDSLNKGAKVKRKKRGRPPH